MITSEFIASQLALAAKATPRPWKVFHAAKMVEIVFGELSTIIKWTGFDSSDTTPKQQLTNARYIAIACNNYPDVLLEVERLRGIIAEALKEARDGLDETS